MLTLEQVRQRISSGKPIEKILEDIDWKEFEELVGKILKEHDFKLYNNFIFTTENRYEIDILAIKGKKLLAIDCKYWGKGRYKKTSLRYAARDQKERLKQFKKFLKKNRVSQKSFNLNRGIQFIPLIITWLEEDIIECEDVFIIPVWKFNQFLLDLGDYI